MDDFWGDASGDRFWLSDRVELVAEPVEATRLTNHRSDTFSNFKT